MIGTILLAGAIALVGAITWIYMLVQRKRRSLDEKAFEAWVIREFFGVRVNPTSESKQESQSRTTKARDARLNQPGRRPPSNPGRRDQVQAKSG